jgi:hypothetical protein
MDAIRAPRLFILLDEHPYWLRFCSDPIYLEITDPVSSASIDYADPYFVRYIYLGNDLLSSRILCSSFDRPAKYSDC